MGHYLSEMPDGYRDMIAKVGSKPGEEIEGNRTCADTIQEARFTDGGDGSVSVKITFSDSSEYFENVDLDYDLDIVSTRQANGDMSYPGPEES